MTREDGRVSEYQYDYPEPNMCPYQNKFCSLLNIRGACESCDVSKELDKKYGLVK
jgi:hypothetical protein